MESVRLVPRLELMSGATTIQFWSASLEMLQLSSDAVMIQVWGAGLGMDLMSDTIMM